MREPFHSLGTALSWLLLPGHCHLCLLPSRRPRDLCTYCQAALPWQLAPCPGCALSPWPDRQADHPMRIGNLCLPCRRRKRPVREAVRVVAPLNYRDAAQWLVRQQKQHRGVRSVVASRLLAELLGDAILASYGASMPLPEVVVPVPLHWRRLAARRYNQAERIADWLARRLQLPLQLRAARRTRATPSQQGLGQRARAANVANAFVATPAVAGLRVAIVDDVLTTGATVRALARALRAAGASEIHVWAAARAPLRHSAGSPR